MRTRSTASAVAALGVAVLLTGCVQVQRMPTTPVSVDQLRAIQAETADSVWAQTGLPDDLRPTNIDVQMVRIDDYGVAFADCMNAAGFDNYVGFAGGYSVASPTTEDAEVLASYTCNMSLVMAPEDSGILTAAQQDYYYDYFVQSLVPCLRVHDVEIPDVPTREEVVASPWGWNPYWSLSRDDQALMRSDSRMQELCPMYPPGALFTPEFG